MRIAKINVVGATTLATAALAAAAVIGLPTGAGAATPASSVQTAPCATSSGFQQVKGGQTIGQVQQEMGSAGTVTDTSTKEGFQTLELEWRSCSALGLIRYGVDFHAEPNQPFLVLGKSALPPTTLDG